MGHPYYHKVYYPVINQNVMVTGMDSLLWSFGEAELQTTDEKTRERYEDFRQKISLIIKRLVADLPDPKIDEQEDDEE